MGDAPISHLTPHTLFFFRFLRPCVVVLVRGLSFFFRRENIWESVSRVPFGLVTPLPPSPPLVWLRTILHLLLFVEYWWETVGIMVMGYLVIEGEGKRKRE